MAGDQDPVTPSVEVVGSENEPPSLVAATWLKVGEKPFETTTVIVVVDAHCPEFGVNVQVVVDVLFIVGDQIPVMLLVDVVGKVNDPPEQIGGI